MAGSVAAVARRAGSLTAGGQWAAFAMGTVVSAAGWGYAALLIAYFVASTLLTRLGAAEKAARTASMLPAVTARDATQVAANGGLFAALVLAGEAAREPLLALAGIGALSAAAADTWATEVGTLWGGRPRAVLGFAPLEPGASGGVTWMGSAAGLVAAALVAAAGAALVRDAGRSAAAVGTALLLAGVGGNLGDSVLGATVQSKRWCDQCRTWTERRVHTCQYRSKHARGIRWMTNDAVNVLATVTGAALALGAALLLD